MMSESGHQSKKDIFCDIFAFFFLGCRNQLLTEVREKRDAFTLVTGIKYNSIARKPTQWFVHSEGIRAF